MLKGQSLKINIRSMENLAFLNIPKPCCQTNPYASQWQNNGSNVTGNLPGEFRLQEIVPAGNSEH